MNAVAIDFECVSPLLLQSIKRRSSKVNRVGTQIRPLMAVRLSEDVQLYLWCPHLEACRFPRPARRRTGRQPLGFFFLGHGSSSSIFFLLPAPKVELIIIQKRGISATEARYPLHEKGFFPAFSFCLYSFSALLFVFLYSPAYMQMTPPV